MDFEIDVDSELLAPPVRRAAYSDRMAWLMAVMSLLAYVPFEAPPTRAKLREMAEAIAGRTDVDEVLSELNKLVRPGEGKKGKAVLETQLGRIGFELIDTISVTDGIRIDTQAFIAKVRIADGQSDAGDPDKEILVIAFRGTEPTKLADIRVDAQAEMIAPADIQPAEIEPEGQLTLEKRGPARVHQGFYTAYKSVESRLNEIIIAHKPAPVYVTGHSLGGALAMVATRFIANRSEGACYTFGAPRVGNEAFAEQIFTPVYRVVNESDGVPGVPPAHWQMAGLIWLADRFEWMASVIPVLKRMSEYRHYGDMRHLSASRIEMTETGMARYPELKIRTAPLPWERWSGLMVGGIWKRFARPLADHDIARYADKLRAHARATGKNRPQNRKCRQPKPSPGPGKRWNRRNRRSRR